MTIKMVRLWAPRAGWERCRKCGTKETPHAYDGLCERCIVLDKYHENPEQKRKYQKEYREKKQAKAPAAWQKKQAEARKDYLAKYGYGRTRQSSQINYTKQRAAAIVLRDAKYVPLESVEISGLRTNIRPDDPLKTAKVIAFKEVVSDMSQMTDKEKEHLVAKLKIRRSKQKFTRRIRTKTVKI